MSPLDGDNLGRPGAHKVHHIKGQHGDLYAVPGKGNVRNPSGIKRGDSSVMEENELYEGCNNNNMKIPRSSEPTVMEENELYEGCNNIMKKPGRSESTVIEENELYEGCNENVSTAIPGTSEYTDKPEELYTETNIDVKKKNVTEVAKADKQKPGRKNSVVTEENELYEGYL